MEKKHRQEARQQTRGTSKNLVHEIDEAIDEFREQHFRQPEFLLLNYRTAFVVKKEIGERMKYIVDARNNLIGSTYRGLEVFECGMDIPFIVIGGNITKLLRYARREYI